MSSAGNNLPRILRGVLTRNGAASTPELVADSGLTHPTVRHHMRFLGERGVGVHKKAAWVCRRAARTMLSFKLGRHFSVFNL
jgi:predicted ArsR family transcriptional regulator